MDKKIISTEKAPQAIGPYSQAIVANGFLFTSGMVPIDPATNQLVEGDITVQQRFPCTFLCRSCKTSKRRTD